MNTGMRRGEIFDLRWSHMDFDRGVTNVIKTKTKRSRVVVMNLIVLALMNELRARTPNASRDTFVFQSEKTGEELRDIKHSFHSALMRAKIEDFRFHDLRHTAGTRLADAGAHITIIASVLGHSSLKMTMRYVTAVDAAKREAMAKLASKSVLSKQASEGEKAG
jgi:integrase